MSFVLFTDGEHPGVISTAIPGMDTALNPAEDFPDIDRYDLGEKGQTIQFTGNLPSLGLCISISKGNLTSIPSVGHHAWLILICSNEGLRFNISVLVSPYSDQITL